ncbi:MAG: alkaline shock response membrane anchor protein AmaP [Ignavibacteriales bacterium]
MKIIGKIFLSLYGFVMTIFSITLITILGMIWNNSLSYEFVGYQFKYFLSYPMAFPIAITAFSVIFLISFILIFVGISKKERREPVLISTDSGQISISLESFESIASSAVKKIVEAKEYFIKVKNINSNVSVFVKTFAVPESNIPELGKSIQAKIIESIETTTGVKVLDVRVKVENIYNNNSSIKSSGNTKRELE